MAESNQPVAAPQMTLVAVPTVVPQGTESLVIQPVNVSALCAEYEKKLFPLLDEGSRLLGLAQEKKPGAIKIAAISLTPDGEDIVAALQKIEPFYENIDKSIAAIKTIRESFETHFANSTNGAVDIAKLEEAVETTLKQANQLISEGHQLVGPPGEPLPLEEKKKNLIDLAASAERKAMLNNIHKTLEATAEMAKSL